MKNFLKTAPLFLFFLPLFFVLHGYTEHFNFVPLPDALVLFTLYLVSSLILACLSWFFFRSFRKAFVLAFFIMAYQFFFGSMQDLLRNHFHGTFIHRYSFILPVSFIFFFALIIWLRKRKTPLAKFVFYLNSLLILFVISDSVWLITKIIDQRKNSLAGKLPENFIRCDSCNKPDIYFIVLDEYAGNRELKDIFHFDNSSFENELSKRSFHVVTDSRSNYNSTPFSIASILNMEYLDLNMKTKGAGNIDYSYKMVRDNKVLQFLNYTGYQFYNYSIFDFKGNPSLQYDGFLPTKTKLITSQTFTSRIWSDIQLSVRTGKFHFKPAEERLSYEHLHYNQKVLSLIENTAAKKTAEPKFIYAHLMMPHFPFYFDSKGKPATEKQLLTNNAYNKHDYVEYLQYCNEIILSLADSILKNSSRPPVIVLLSDHGFRPVKQVEERKYLFMNLDAIYLPGKNYAPYYNGMTSVNQFRIFLNEQFHQQLPLLKDSTIYLWQ